MGEPAGEKETRGHMQVLQCSRQGELEVGEGLNGKRGKACSKAKQQLAGAAPISLPVLWAPAQAAEGFLTDQTQCTVH